MSSIGKPTGIVRRDLLPGISALVGEINEGYRQHAYVISFGDFSVLVDVNDESMIDALNDFPSPRHLLLSHRHVRRHEAAIERHFRLQVWLHPSDADAPRKGPAANTPFASAYHDPFAGGLASLGFRFVAVPGHTPASTFIWLERDGGALFVGDAVIGSKPGDPVALHFPPDFTCDEPELARRSLRALKQPSHCSVLPLHGEPILAQRESDIEALWADLRASLGPSPALS